MGWMDTYQDGGVIKPKEWLESYISSPKYKERLESSGYDDIENEIKKRDINIKNVKYIEQDGHSSFMNQIKHMWNDTPYSRIGSKYDDRYNTIIYDKSQAKRLGLNKEEILSHEYGHAVIDNLYENTTTSRYRLNKYDTNELSKRLKSYKGQSKHDKDPTESKADIDALRYQLKKYKIYDANTEDFNENHLKETNGFFKDRLLKNYSDKDLIWLMNNIAQNNNKSNTKGLAQKGKIIEDDRGQWAHPGKITRINSNDITMKGVNYPVLGISNTGDEQLMMPGEDYKFDGESVTEYPIKWLDKY